MPMVVERKSERFLVVTEDGWDVWVRNVGLLASFGPVVLVAGLIGGSPAWAWGVGALLAAVQCHTDYTHNERWEFDRLTGVVTRTRRLLFVAPLRRRWPAAEVRRVEAQERIDGDGGTYHVIALYMERETLTVGRLDKLGGDGVRALADDMRAIALGAGRPHELTGLGEAGT